MCWQAEGRRSRHPGKTSKRLEEDSYARFKYDATAEVDGKIISRMEQIAEKRNVSMTEVSLATGLYTRLRPAGCSRVYSPREQQFAIVPCKKVP